MINLQGIDKIRPESLHRTGHSMLIITMKISDDFLSPRRRRVGLHLPRFEALILGF